jgi:hypothetical protein
MTALATGLALVPNVLGGTRAGTRLIEQRRREEPAEDHHRKWMFDLMVPALYLEYGRSALTTVEETV